MIGGKLSGFAYPIITVIILIIIAVVLNNVQKEYFQNQNQILDEAKNKLKKVKMTSDKAKVFNNLINKGTRLNENQKNELKTFINNSIV